MNTVENVLRILEEKGIEYAKSEHEAVRTSEEAAKIRGVDLKSGVKALLLKTEEGRFIMVLIEADKKIDFELIAHMEKTKKLRLARPEEVLNETGCQIGGVPPFGHTKNGQPVKIKTYMDKNILRNEFVNCNAGDRTVSVSMRGKDLEKVIETTLF